MASILQKGTIDKLPMAELSTTLDGFLEPVLMHLPEKRLRAVGRLAVQGVLGGQSPLVTQMARGVAREGKTVLPTARRLYRFVWNPRFSHRDLLKGLYGIAQCGVAEHAPSHLVVALDPVNFEKPYTEELEGVSTVMKSTPPGPGGEKRLTSGYPAITATVVNLPEPVITYANWFSYAAFRSRCRAGRPEDLCADEPGERGIHHPCPSQSEGRGLQRPPRPLGRRAVGRPDHHRAAVAQAPGGF